MHHLAKVNCTLILLVSLLTPLFGAARASRAAKVEYLTEDEIDMIRDAQELSARVPTYFKLAERRLVFLGIMERSKEQIEKEQKAREKREKEQKKSTTDTRATANKAPFDPDDTAYLDLFTPAELLRGYIQVLEEVTTNIDDAYARKLDIRDPLEDLAKFVKDTIPLLEKFKAKGESERSALQDALDKARQTLADAKQALSIVPKTEKKRKP